jgi:hypothetical protein
MICLSPVIAHDMRWTLSALTWEFPQMASDRGTVTRGSGIDQQGPWAEPTLPAGRRMPSAPRERKPALAVLAVLLIVGGALAAGVLVIQTGHRVAAVEVTQAIPQGEQIPASAITEVQIAADSGVRYVSWQFAVQVPQYFATAAIPAGTLLNSGMIAKTRSTPSGAAEVGLALKDGQVPGNLKAGDPVRIFSTQVSSGSGCPGRPGATLTHGTVIAISSPGSGASLTDVLVAIDPQDAGAVACNTANGTAAIAIVPPGAAGDTGGSAAAGPGGTSGNAAG